MYVCIYTNKLVKSGGHLSNTAWNMIKNWLASSNIIIDYCWFTHWKCTVNLSQPNAENGNDGIFYLPFYCILMFSGSRTYFEIFGAWPIIIEDWTKSDLL